MSDFTKIRWAGEDCILITIREQPVLILTKYEIEDLCKKWLEKEID